MSDAKPEDMTTPDEPINFSVESADTARQNDQDARSGRRTQLERLASVEDKVDEAQAHMSQFAMNTTKKLENIDKRITRMDLNGHAANLRALADATPEILKIVPVIPTLEKLASEDVRGHIFRQELGRKLGVNTRIMRGAVASLFGAICYALFVQPGPVGTFLIHWISHL